ncbi:MAG TPA: substrate-binding domain-containing protein [Anaerolineales bacterium]
MAEAGIPMVVIGRPFHSENVSYIDIDNVSASQSAVKHLICLGYRRIGTIAGPSASTVGVDRLAGYRKALTAAGMSLDDALMVEGDFTEAGGYRAMQRMLPARPEAVFAASDIMALGAIRLLREAGLRVPQDVAFVGFDDLPLALLEDARLTTIRQPVIQFGSRAVELLLDLIEDGVKPPCQIIMDAELIVRNSCGASLRQKTV